MRSGRRCTAAFGAVILTIGMAWTLGAAPARAATFTVVSTGDGADTNTSDGVCRDSNGACTLRAAIQEANATVASDTITFAIGAGEQTIRPATALPLITRPVVINGTTQPEFNGKPIIELDGSLITAPARGIFISGGGTTVRGLVVNRFSSYGISLGGGNNMVVGNFVGTDLSGTLRRPNKHDGITVRGSGDRIGGSSPGDRNVISGNNESGIALDTGAANTVIQGNFVGTDRTGTAPLGNGNGARGIHMNGFRPGVLVGGANPGEGNLISGNGEGVAAFGGVVQGNFIGTDATGTSALPNTTGLTLHGFSAEETRATGNVVAGNGTGVHIRGPVAVLEGNLIGVTASGVALGNQRDGVEVLGSGSTIVNNTIANNGDDGIAMPLPSSSGVRLSENRVFGNAGDGIDHSNDGPAPNDAGDGDTGPNQLQNHPVLDRVGSAGSTRTFEGRLDSTPNQTFTLEFFANAACDASGYGEGATFLGSVSVATDGTGTAKFLHTVAGTLANGTPVTATATDAAGNSSEFSPCKLAGSEATALIARPALAELDPAPTVHAPVLSARLTTSAGAPVAGRAVRFVAGDQTVCQAPTDAGGVAACGTLEIVPAVVLAGGYTAVFDGDDVLLGSSANAPLATVLGTPMP